MRKMLLSATSNEGFLVEQAVSIGYRGKRGAPKPQTPATVFNVKNDNLQ